MIPRSALASPPMSATSSAAAAAALPSPLASRHRVAQPGPSALRSPTAVAAASHATAASTTTAQDLAQRIPKASSLMPLVRQLLDTGSTGESVVCTVEKHYQQRIGVLESALQERSFGSLEAQALQSMLNEERKRADKLQEEVDLLSLRYKQVRPEHPATVGDDDASSVRSGAPSPLGSQHQLRSATSAVMKNGSIVAAVDERTQVTQAQLNSRRPGRVTGQSANRASATVNFSFARPFSGGDGTDGDQRVTTAGSVCGDPSVTASGNPAGHNDSIASFIHARRDSLPQSLATPPALEIGGGVSGIVAAAVANFRRGTSKSISSDSHAAPPPDVQKINVAAEGLSVWELRLYNDELQRRLDVLTKELEEMRRLLDRGRGERAALGHQNRALHTLCLTMEDEVARCREQVEKERAIRREMEDDAGRDKLYFSRRIEELRAKLRRQAQESENEAKLLKRSLGDANAEFDKERQSWREREAALLMLLNAARRKAKDVEEGKISEEMRVIQEQLDPLREALVEAMHRAEAAEAALDPLKQQLHDLLNNAPQQHAQTPRKQQQHAATNLRRKDAKPVRATPVVADAQHLTIDATASPTRAPGAAPSLPPLLPPIHPTNRAATSMAIGASDFDDTLDAESRRAIQRSISVLEREVAAVTSLATSQQQQQQQSVGGASPPLLDDSVDAAAASVISRSRRRSVPRLVDTKNDPLLKVEREMRREKKLEALERAGINIASTTHGDIGKKDGRSSRHVLRDAFSDHAVIPPALIKQLAAAKVAAGSKRGKGVFK